MCPAGMSDGVCPLEKQTSKIKLKLSAVGSRNRGCPTTWNVANQGKDASEGGYPNVRQFMLAAALSMAS